MITTSSPVRHLTATKVVVFVNFISKLNGVVDAENVDLVDGSLRGISYSFFMWLNDNASVMSSDTWSAVDVHGWYDETLGVGLDPVTGLWLACVHSKKTVLLHKYVEKCEFDPNCIVYGYGLKEADVVCYPEHIVDMKGSSILDVKMTDQVLSVCGYCNSVTTWRESDLVTLENGGVVCSLYDFLIEFCRYLDINIFQYKRLRFSSCSMGWLLSIDFAQTPEAKRFFTKMWLDACSERALGFGEV